MGKKITIKPASKIRQKKDLPKEIEQKISEWVNSENKEAEIPLKTGKTVRVNFGVDEELHAKLKLYCLKNKITVKDLCVELILDKIKE